MKELLLTRWRHIQPIGLGYDHEEKVLEYHNTVQKSLPEFLQPKLPNDSYPSIGQR